jgi:MFS family permease
MTSRSLISRTGRVLVTYLDRLTAFHPNARLYLASVVLAGAAIGVYRLLFNFYILSQGYDESLLGVLVTTSSLSALLSALPMGYLADRIGRKAALILGGLITGLVIALIVLFPSVPVFIGANVLFGLGQSLSGVTMGPFLMENSGEKERTYLFSFSSGLLMGSGFVGSWIGGYLPTWLGVLQNAAPTSTAAYGASLLLISAVASLAVVPLFFLRGQRIQGERNNFASLTEMKRQSGKLSRLVLPMLATSIGAGMFMPFMNVFFRQVHHQPDPVIGSLFAWGSLAMGLGLIIAPPLAERFGKIQLIVVTQSLAIPFLAVLGFSPWFPLSAGAFYIRLALMNMSGPVYQTFVLEQVEPKSRATVASLVSMANSFGWAFSPSISGWIQVSYGFGPVFLVTMVLYILSTFLYWRFFWPAPLRPAGGAKPLRSRIKAEN